MSEFIKVALATDIPPGQSRIFEVKGNQVAVTNLNGNFYAFLNVCPHRGGPVGEGDIIGTEITCPWHGWTFDVTTCLNTSNPTAKLKKYDLKVENGEIHLSA